MKQALWIFLVLCASAYFFSHGFGNSFAPADEYLEYHAYWGFVNLGSIKVWTRVNDGKINSRFQLDSNPLLFFINVHYGFESEFDVDSLTDAKFYIYETVRGRKVVTSFERENEKIIAIQKDVKTGEIIQVVEKNTGREYYNGITAFYLTRKLLGTGQKLTVPILIQLDVKDVEIEFPNENSSIDFMNSKVRVKQVSGVIPFVAEEIAGVSGEFKAFYTDDSARIPVRAYFKTFVGNVKVELKNWERKNWRLPSLADKNKGE